MNYFSTGSRKRVVAPREAVLEGLAADGGLFMPEKLPAFDAAELSALRRMSFPELSLRVLRPFFDDIPPADFESIISDAFDFPVPLVDVEPRVSALELFHGPTFAFKDFGARVLARLTAYYRKNSSRELQVLVATSGDTGSAVANGFFRLPGIRVVVLYPRGRVSRIQEQQLTTLGENITALEVEGTFDDCQRLVKAAFLDTELRKRCDLTSANSINIGRLLPQICYYVHAWCRLPEDAAANLIVSVPSGNLGNLAAGILASRIGVPIVRFVAALNRNDVYAEYLSSGSFRPRPSIATLSNSMDVGNPSNIARLIELGVGVPIEAYSFSDDETSAEIARMQKEHKYLLDPHGAIGLLGLRRALAGTSDAHGVFLATAHPAKFVETVERAAGITVELPPELARCLAKPKSTIQLPATLDALKSVLPARSAP